MFPTPALVELIENNLTRDLRAFLPELVLVGVIVLMLFARLFTRFQRVHLVPFAMIGTAFALLLAVRQWTGTEKGFTTFGGMLVYDSFAIYGRIFLLLFLFGSLVLSQLTGIPDREDSADYSTMILGSTLGMMLMTSANHLLMAFIAIEMASVPSYALAGFMKGRRSGSEAALKYVVFGASAAGVMLYGISLITAKFGTGSLPDLVQGYAAVLQSGSFDLSLAAGTMFVLVGLGFKLSVVPFHFWCPDVFHGAAAEIGAFLSVASKGAAVLLTGRFLLALDLPATAGVGLAIFAAMTMTLGNLAAFGQTNLKRLLAYSTIAHAGYLMMALSTMRPDGISAANFYIVAYLLMNLGAFAIVALVRNRTGTEEIEGYQGLLIRSPILAVTLVLFFMSLLGLPPFAGFVAKLQVFLSVYDCGARYSSAGQSGIATVYYVLLLIGAVNTVFSLAYYLRVIRVMTLESPTESTPLKTSPMVRMFVGVLAGLLVVMGLLWNPLTRASEQATASLQTIEREANR